MKENIEQIKIKIEGINEISLDELNSVFWIITRRKEDIKELDEDIKLLDEDIKVLDEDIKVLDLVFFHYDNLKKTEFIDFIFHNQIYIKQIRPGCIEILAHLSTLLDIISLLFEVEIAQKYLENPEVYNAKIKEYQDLIKRFISKNRSKNNHDDFPEGGEKDISVKIEKSEPEK